MEKERDDIDVLTLAAAKSYADEKVEEAEHEIQDLGLKVENGVLCAVYGTD